MSNPSELTRLLVAPNGEAQSFLEGIFSPRVQYDGITNGILAHLSNDDTNAMRRTNSTMNYGLMTLRSDGIFRHTQEAMRDNCDEISIFTQLPCQNPINSSARLRYCTGPRYNRSSLDTEVYYHYGNEGFLTCTTCCRTHLARWRCPDRAYWQPCAVCTETQERRYPDGAQFCKCLAEIKRRVLCCHCLWLDLSKREAKLDSSLEERKSIGLDENGMVNFSRHPPHSLPVCLGCGIRPSDFTMDLTSYLCILGQRITTICFFCREYNIVPSNHPPATSTDQLPPPLRRSARLAPAEAQAAVQTRLSYLGTAARSPNTEPQNAHGFSVPEPRRREFPRGKHVI